MKISRVALLIIIVLIMGVFGCGPKLPQFTASGERVLMIQGSVQLYRNKPHIWPAKGRIAVIKNKLIWIPVPYFGIFPVQSKDSTFIKLNEIEEFKKRRWMLIFPFRLDVITQDGGTYPLFLYVAKGSFGR